VKSPNLLLSRDVSEIVVNHVGYNKKATK